MLKAQFKDDIGCAQYSALILAHMHQHRTDIYILFYSPTIKFYFLFIYIYLFIFLFLFIYIYFLFIFAFLVIVINA